MSGSIVISNYTDTPIEIITVPDRSIKETNKLVHTIHPKDSCVFFLSRVDSLSWEKKE